MDRYSAGHGIKPLSMAALAFLLSGAGAIVMPSGTVSILLGPQSNVFRLRNKKIQGKVPSLGWNSWNAYHCDIDESKFLSAAELIVSSGLLDAGYNYVNSKLDFSSILVNQH